MGKDYGAPYGLKQGFVNAIMNGSQTVLKNEKSNECNELKMSLNDVETKNSNVIMNKFNEGDKISNTFDVLFNEKEQLVNTGKLYVMQRNDEQLKVLFIEISALNEGQVHSCNYSIKVKYIHVIIQ